MTISIMYLPQKSWAAVSEQGSCHKDQSLQLQPSDHGDTRTADVLRGRFYCSGQTDIV